MNSPTEELIYECLPYVVAVLTAIDHGDMELSGELSISAIKAAGDRYVALLELLLHFHMEEYAKSDGTNLAEYLQYLGQRAANGGEGEE